MAERVSLPNAKANIAGKLIVIEGTDGSGSSTQIAETVLPWLEDVGLEYGWPEKIHGTGFGTAVVTTREPGGTERGEEIRNTILHDRNVTLSPLEEFNLFTEQRCELSTQIVTPQLALGKIVVSERSFISSYAYQGGGLELDSEMIVEKTAENISPRMMKPDIAILIHVNPEVAEQRMLNAGVSKDKIENRDPSFFGRVYEGYLEAADRFDMIVIDGTLEVEQVGGLVIAALQERIFRPSADNQH